MAENNLRTRILLLAMLFWTATLGASLLWNLHNSERQTMAMAYAEAQTNLDKDITFRRWATTHGGVYVPITDTQKSIPWLAHVPGRDVTTTDGRQLTLLNPATMLRQMMDAYAEAYGIRGRIIGLRYLNPGNAPDDWETKQLEAFTRGEKKEVWEITDIDGKKHLRYLRAMFMDPGCDKCHGILGYKTGDMRGATGLSLPLDPYLQQITITRLYLGVSHAILWLIGLAGILWASHLAGRWAIEREKAQAELLQHRRHLEELVQQRTRELKQTEAHAELILHSTADGLFGLDTTGHVTFINPAACQMLGYRPEQVIGHPSHALFHHSRPDGSPYPASECPTYAAFRTGQASRIADEVYWHADGHPIPVMYASHPIIENGKITGAVTSFVDLSAQHAAAQAREQALIAAENLARVRSEFLANMSHEIRTPLNGIFGFAEIGRRNCQNSDKARDAFTKIQSSGKRLLGVVNDILDFSKIEAGKLNIEATEVHLAEVIDRTLELVRDNADAKHLELRLELPRDVPATCISDPLRLGQILLNLLSNAVKFTERGSVTLSLAQQGDALVFRVADTGIGMTPAQLGELFTPFQQADASASRRFGGTGLGLAISKRILTLMQGEISVQSQPGGGTSVEFRLPYVPTPPAIEPMPIPPVAPVTAQKPLAGLSFLVAEDEVINQAILEENLIEDGARVVMVSNGREAVDRLQRDGRDAYDIVLMDIQMPEMDGYEATRRILELAPDLPIIAQTAHAFQEEQEKCRAAGMVGHIAKPIDPDALIKLVLQHVPAKRRD